MWDVFMELKINFEKLDCIMQAFYTLTKIKIVIFDEKRNVIRAYPQNDCVFCRKLKSFTHTATQCAQNDINIFNECKKTGKFIIYTCHAGLIEGCAPLMYNDKIIGYIMFGQISDLPSREILNQNIINICREYGLDEKIFLQYSKSIKLKKHNDITAAAQIFEACISYIILNEMLMPEQDKTMHICEEYILSHLDTVNVESLCAHLNLSRTALYSIFHKKTGLGIASFIRNKQLEESKKLLSETNLSICEISARCGFADYNYFSRVFKKKFGYSAKTYKQHTF